MSKTFGWTVSGVRAGFVVWVLGSLLVACGKKDETDAPAASAGAAAAVSQPASASPSGGAAAVPASGASAPAAPPVSVTTFKVEMKDLAVRLRSAGVVTPIRTVDVKPQVNSVITRVNVKDGQ